jgi:hypothetical protein
MKVPRYDRRVQRTRAARDAWLALYLPGRRWGHCACRAHQRGQCGHRGVLRRGVCVACMMACGVRLQPFNACLYG